MENIKIPNFFKIGLKFRGKWINYGYNECEVISFDVDKNIVEIKINTGESEWVEDDWNLRHTLWGFNSMDYRILTT